MIQRGDYTVVCQIAKKGYLTISGPKGYIVFSCMNADFFFNKGRVGTVKVILSDFQTLLDDDLGIKRLDHTFFKYDSVVKL